MVVLAEFECHLSRARHNISASDVDCIRSVFLIGSGSRLFHLTPADVQYQLLLWRHGKHVQAGEQYSNIHRCCPGGYEKTVCELVLRTVVCEVNAGIDLLVGQTAKRRYACAPVVGKQVVACRSEAVARLCFGCRIGPDKLHLQYAAGLQRSAGWRYRQIVARTPGLELSAPAFLESRFKAQGKASEFLLNARS